MVARPALVRSYRPMKEIPRNRVGRFRVGHLVWNDSLLSLLFLWEGAQ